MAQWLDADVGPFEVDDSTNFLAPDVIGKFSTFRAHGQHVFGLRKRTVSATQYIDPKKGDISEGLELGPDGITTWRPRPYVLHVTLAGMPHRVSHNFGYWHINDRDEIYLPITSQQSGVAGYFIVVQGDPVPGDWDRFAIYCKECVLIVSQFDSPTGELGFDSFWQAESAAVQYFNSDIRHRTCPNCGAVNPLAYCWNPAKDTAEQSSARLAW